MVWLVSATPNKFQQIFIDCLLCTWHWGSNSEQNTVSAYVRVCLQTDSEIKIMKIGMVCYCSPMYAQNLNRTWHI